MTLRSARDLATESQAFKPCPRDRIAIRGWIVAAQEKSVDSSNTQVSLGTRFEAAYDGIFNLALAILNATGWRHRSIEGHHGFVLEAACEALQLRDSVFDRIDALRELRNLKYEGVARSDRDVADALAMLKSFSESAVGWLQKHHSDLLKPG
jgi:hypothetical protein